MAIRQSHVVTALVITLAGCGREAEATRETGALLVRVMQSQSAIPAFQRITVTLDPELPSRRSSDAEPSGNESFTAFFSDVDLSPGTVRDLVMELQSSAGGTPWLLTVPGVQLARSKTAQAAIFLSDDGAGGPRLTAVTSTAVSMTTREAAVLTTGGSATAQGASTHLWSDDCGGTFLPLADDAASVIWAPGTAAARNCIITALVQGPAVLPSQTSASSASLNIGVAPAGTCDPSRPGAVVLGPHFMEGDLKLAPGATLDVGFDARIPGSHGATRLGFSNALASFAFTCVGKAKGGTIGVPMSMPTQEYDVQGEDSKWYPSADRSSPLVFQGSYRVGQECGGATLRLGKGVFTAAVSSTQRDEVDVRWHYRGNGSPANWSETGRVSPGCLTGSLGVAGVIVSPPQITQVNVGQGPTSICSVDFGAARSTCVGDFRADRAYWLASSWYPPPDGITASASLHSSCDGPSVDPSARTLALSESPQRAEFDWRAPPVPEEFNIGLGCVLELAVTFSDPAGSAAVTTKVPVTLRVSP